MTYYLTIPSFLHRQPDGLTHEQRLAKAKGSNIPWKIPGAKKKAKAKKKTGVNEEQRLCLKAMTWTDRMINCLTSKEADEIIFVGRIMQPADEVRMRGEKL
jgi:hypothetical protein